MKEKIKVLIVDDERSDREIYAGILRNDSNLFLEEVANGKEAMDKLKKHSLILYYAICICLNWAVSSWHGSLKTVRN